MPRLPEMTDVITSGETGGLQAGLTIDRLRAAAIGVTPVAIDNTLYDAFGQRQINLMYLPTNYSRVIFEVEPQAAAIPSVLDQLYVSGAGGGAGAAVGADPCRSRTHAPMWMRHSDQFPAATISFDTRPGVSIGAGHRCDPQRGGCRPPAGRNQGRVPGRGRGGGQVPARSRCCCSPPRSSPSTSCWACCTRATPTR